MILFDPIFQGLAVSLTAGEAASTLLSRLAVPIPYYASEGGRKAAGHKATAEPQPAAASDVPKDGTEPRRQGLRDDA